VKRSGTSWCRRLSRQLAAVVRDGGGKAKVTKRDLEQAPTHPEPSKHVERMGLPPVI